MFTTTLRVQEPAVRVTQTTDTPHRAQSCRTRRAVFTLCGLCTMCSHCIAPVGPQRYVWRLGADAARGGLRPEHDGHRGVVEHPGWLPRHDVGRAVVPERQRRVVGVLDVLEPLHRATEQVATADAAAERRLQTTDDGDETRVPLACASTRQRCAAFVNTCCRPQGTSCRHKASPQGTHKAPTRHLLSTRH